MIGLFFMHFFQKHNTYSDQEFLDAIKTGSLPPLVFTHEAHVRLVWIVRINKPEGDISLMVRHLIKDYAEQIGEPQIYHETLTYAAVQIIDHYISISAAKDFDQFIDACPGLLHQFKSLVHQHYSKELLESSKAKNQVLQPDLLSFE